MGVRVSIDKAYNSQQSHFYICLVVHMKRIEVILFSLIQVVILI
jgi:hypothetical protein